MSFMPDLFSLLPTAEDDLALPNGDTAWVFETDADPAPMQMQFSDFGFTDIDIPDVPDLADLVSVQDLPEGYQTSNGSSLSVPVSRSTSTSPALFLSSSSSLPSPRFPVVVEAQPPMGQVQANLLCRSQRCGSETCLTTALRTLMTLHIAHSACLSAHREAPTVQQAWKMETVLSANKDVVASMGPILACPCSAKSLVQLLLLSICGNLIAWNSAMISADLKQQGDDPFSPAGALTAGPTQAPRARVLPQPITIGQHQINGKLGRVLHTQIMAGELRMLEGLVEALSRRFCEAPGSDGTSSTSPVATDMRNANGRPSTSRDAPSFQSKGLSYNVHRHIISSLRTRLENTRAKTFSQG
ncbi:uncharacterized protein BCR38DRAFT_412052 [Pseudomassariella vexata]|uniref:Aflatoxin regulatory protein domain-containing protein n=1 Tax=Pseudomassariella vexata TaxID=1141098 RepID=A0A1Y2DP46_9PEZI|nr:uncharacterized protein BCR38DRAFT_412052 [Pseudomassariella vexata]ORY60949.1 hypothetical protein BCR38DRAFT_412052 [Pseudomassariella vexata]